MKVHLLCCLAALSAALAGEVRIEGGDANVHFLNNGCKITASSCSTLSSVPAEINALEASVKALKEINVAQGKENASLRALLVALTARVIHRARDVSSVVRSPRPIHRNREYDRDVPRASTTTPERRERRERRDECVRVGRTAVASRATRRRVTRQSPRPIVTL